MISCSSLKCVLLPPIEVPLPSADPLLVHVAVVEVLVPVAVAVAAAADGVGVGDAVAATCRAPAGGEAGSEGIQRAGRGAACAGQGLGLDRWAARGNVQGRSLLRGDEELGVVLVARWEG